ncbi:MAG: hydantoinase B/oxoprolinase family protein [Gammaproteobacteria bacterium]|nr:hydantoinase B/oxoprolinase family protein [Gammaproteobacteria bacterium]
MNPIRDQLVWNRLLAIVEEQAQTLMRTAFSTVVREAGDLSAGVFNTQGAMLAQAVTGTPGHVNAMARSVGKFLARHPVETLQPGDVLVTNNPWDGTGHLNDFTVVTPIFSPQEGVRPVALFAATSHIADVGGLGFGPDGREIYEEGLHVPIMPLFERGEINATLMRLIAANVRDPMVAEGDLYSLAACNRTGGEQLLKAMAEFELGEIDSVGQRIIETSRQAMAAQISEVPDGRFRHAMTVDGYDSPITVVCCLTVDGDAIDIDFDGTSQISPHGINVPLNYTEAYASFGVRCVVGNDIPNNAGSLAAVTVRAPAGCILNAEFPAAVSARHALGQMLPDVILGCLEQALPGSAPAEGASCIWNPVLRSASGAQGNFSSRAFVINPIFNGGTGARPAQDGLSTTAFPSGVRTTPTEVNEVSAPLIIRRREYLPDTGGSGEYRGGLGQVVEIEHAEGAPFVISKMFDRIEHAAQGRRGGEAGKPGRVFLRLADGTEQPLRGKGRDTVPAGATLVMETPGGGGIGDAHDRDPASVRADMDAGLTTPSE